MGAVRKPEVRKSFIRLKEQKWTPAAIAHASVLPEEERTPEVMRRIEAFLASLL